MEMDKEDGVMDREREMCVCVCVCVCVYIYVRSQQALREKFT